MRSNRSNGILVLTLAVLVIACFGALSLFGVGIDHVASSADIRQGLDLKSGVTILYQAGSEDIAESDMNKSIELMLGRLDKTAYAGARVSRQGAQQIRVDIPGVVNPESAADEIGMQAVMRFYDEEYNVLLTSDDVARVASANQSSGGTPSYGLAIEFTNAGSTKFANATRDNIGKAIYVSIDGTTLAAPSVQEEISGGFAVIPLGLTAQGAADLAALINAGPMPVPLYPVSIKNVGPTLGGNAMRNLSIAGIICLALILLCMPLFYKSLGAAADLSVLICIGITATVFSLTGIRLTLPGVAGILAAVGLAVDAIVITFERTRDEAASGRNLRACVDAGFKRAFPAVLDAHIVAAIVAALLYLIGTGPVKDFALTLLIGVPISAFTALVSLRFITKALIDAGASNPRLYIRAKREASA